jgi:hypothetical protein
MTSYFIDEDSYHCINRLFASSPKLPQGKNVFYFFYNIILQNTEKSDESSILTARTNENWVEMSML